PQSGRPARAAARRRYLPGGGAQIVRPRAGRPQSRGVVDAAGRRRFSCRDPHAPLRHVDLRAAGGSARRRQSVRAQEAPQYRPVCVGREPRAPGTFHNEDDLADYDILDYDIDLTISPDRLWLDSRARVLLKVRSAEINTLTLRLADSLVVQSIASDQFGGLFALRLKNQNSIIIKLPTQVPRDTVMTLTVVYSGRVEPQVNDRELLAFQRGRDVQVNEARFATEPSWLYSSRIFWYPQAPVTDYATARLQINVPASLGCVASGDLAPGS